MNEIFSTLRHVGTPSTHLNGSATESSALGIHKEIDDPAYRHRAWRLWNVLRGQETVTNKRRNTEFLAAFSHELRTSLGAIRSASYILRKEPQLTPDAVKARELIDRQAGLMSRLIEDLLDVSRLRSGQLRLNRDRIDLCTVVVSAIQTADFALLQRGHRLTRSFPAGPLWLYADATRLEQVFVNLLVNAAKYTDAGGQIELIVARDGDAAVVRVRDTGIGIAPDVLPHVFDLFVQADPSARRGDSGLGIGLALVRSLVECHSGSVTAESAGLRRGSEFKVHLPLADGPKWLVPSH